METEDYTRINSTQENKDESEKQEKGGIGDPDNINERNYWIYSPGEKANKWNEYYKQKVMGIGWNKVSDLRKYNSKKEIVKKLQEINKTNSKYPNDSNALWQFSNEIKPGDIIFAKKGLHKIIGYGIVDGEYYYDNTKDKEYTNIIPVNWKEKENFNYKDTLPLKTLTKITDYPEMIEKIKNLFEDYIEEEPKTNYPEYKKEDFLKDSFINEEEYNKLIDLIKYKMNVIIEGAPGVGKTYISKRLAYSIIGVKDKERVELVQFHQSYSYEDFIMGYRPSEEGFDLEKGIFYNFCKKAENDEENSYFFIIDEINRGNLSKIFGELFMLIEKDKRGNKVPLLYNKESFSIPKNLYILGLMNTADRSLAIMDYALRRRFAFYTLRPAFNSENFKKYGEELNNPKFNNLIELIKELNNEIKEDEVLGEGFQIGHSYFCNLKKDTIDKNLKYIINFEIIPLLKEYWFDEPNKVETWSSKLRNIIE
ncbi:hypothetical protein BGI41_02985 [Methanobrevibacter sp. 87.7]|uniref:AAA family ATPase n=1 Tax=Methanobrevibacter sp. 87.7 TaxID=387957 RepID=UPI000B514B94|nr:AAA family ATPase [Methanobrevibacter sp. 87.7]OWT33320.1 hypothetical protein BGI41_02985 [Methanobrevibacter sp. 87.7]